MGRTAASAETLGMGDLGSVMSNVFFHHLLALTSKLRGTLPVLLFYLSENSWCFSFALLPRLISWLAEARAGTAGPEDLLFAWPWTILHLHLACSYQQAAAGVWGNS